MCTVSVDTTLYVQVMCVGGIVQLVTQMSYYFDEYPQTSPLSHRARAEHTDIHDVDATTLCVLLLLISTVFIYH